MEYDGNKKGSIWYDQIQRLITDLNQNPDSRRLMVSAWNVGELDQMILPPCHYGFQVYTRELSFDERYKIYTKSDKTWEEGGGNAYGKINGLDIMDDAGIPKRAISLMWNQRSVDTLLGLPFNIASYGLLLSLIAKVVNMVPDELIGNLGDTHLYLNHIDQAIEQKSRQPYELPWVKLNFEFTYLDGYIVDWEKIDINQIELLNYLCHPPIKAPLSN
jgi:thymidylate synthase